MKRRKAKKIRVCFIVLIFILIIGCSIQKKSFNPDFDKKIAVLISNNENINNYDIYQYYIICKRENKKIFIALDKSDHGNKNLLFTYYNSSLTILDTIKDSYSGKDKLKEIFPKLSSSKINKYSKRINKVLAIHKKEENSW